MIYVDINNSLVAKRRWLMQKECDAYGRISSRNDRASFDADSGVRLLRVAGQSQPWLREDALLREWEEEKLSSR